MKRRILMKGDKTTAGGVILEGVASAFNGDEELAFHGAKIWCPACQSQGTLCNDGPRWSTSFDNKEVGVENDLCICKCSPPPRLIASQDGMFMSFEPHDLASMGYHADGSLIAAAKNTFGAVPADAIPLQNGDTANGNANPGTPLGDAAPFAYTENQASGDEQTYAARGVSENDEGECLDQYERDMDECHAYRLAMGGARFMDACAQRAFMNYQQCRGY